MRTLVIVVFVSVAACSNGDEARRSDLDARIAFREWCDTQFKTFEDPPKNHECFKVRLNPDRYPKKKDNGTNATK